MREGSDQRHAIPRPTARAIVLDESDRVLLMRGIGTFVDRVWFMPGGGLESGESHVQAVRRELWEETTLRVVDVGTAVWIREHAWCNAEGVWYRSQERFFVVRTRHFEPRFARADDPEAAAISELRWWSIPDIATSEDVFAPRRLAELLRPIAAGHRPTDVIDVGI